MGDFETVLAAKFLPELREMGFTGKKWQMHRLRDPFIHCVWVQQRSDSTSVCVNLGVHLTFVPILGEMPTMDKITQPDCSITSRLAKEGQADCWWTKEDPEKAADEIVRLLKDTGARFFAKFEVFPGILGVLQVEDIESGSASRELPGLTPCGIALLLARVWDYLGDNQKVVQFAEHGLRVAPPMASGSKAALKKLLNRAGPKQ